MSLPAQQLMEMSSAPEADSPCTIVGPFHTPPISPSLQGGSFAGSYGSLTDANREISLGGLPPGRPGPALYSHDSG